MKENLQFTCLYQYYIPEDSLSLILAKLLYLFLQYTLPGIPPKILVLSYFPFHFLEETTDVLLD